MKRPGYAVLAVCLVVGSWLGWRHLVLGSIGGGRAGAPTLTLPHERSAPPMDPDASPAELVEPSPQDENASARGLRVTIDRSVTNDKREDELAVESIAGMSSVPATGQASADDLSDPLAMEDNWPPPAVGSITGSLVPDSGRFHGDTTALLRGITLDLVSREAPHVKRVAVLTPVLDGEGELVRIDFAAADLPGIEFELTLSTLDHRRWYPETALVLPPADGVEFRCFDDEPKVALVFEVVDAATGEEIEVWSVDQFRMSVSAENGVLLHAGPLATDAFPSSSTLEWVVVSAGYAPAFGNELAFTVDAQTGAWRTRVALERGFAFRLVVLAPDPELRPAAGAAVSLDGSSVGATDSMGQLVVRGAEPAELASIEWRNLRTSGALDEVCLERRSYMRVAVLRE